MKGKTSVYEVLPEKGWPYSYKWDPFVVRLCMMGRRDEFYISKESWRNRNVTEGGCKGKSFYAYVIV